MTSRLRELIQQLGEAIHESVIESEQIAGVVQDIRQHGFDVLLMLEATIGLNEVVKAAKDGEAASEPGDGRFHSARERRDDHRKSDYEENYNCQLTKHVRTKTDRTLQSGDCEGEEGEGERDTGGDTKWATL